MKRLLLPAIILAVFAGPASADLYKWTDERGVVYATDSMEKVPSKYRGSVSVFQEGVKEAPPLDEAPQIDGVQMIDNGQTDDGAAGPAEELYGGETLEWWTESFEEKRSAITGIENSIDTKKKFIEVFEAGRRFGQVFDGESVDKYSEFKKELPDDIKRLSALKEEYYDFQRKANGAGVPRSIRER